MKSYSLFIPKNNLKTTSKKIYWLFIFISIDKCIF